MRYFQDVHRRCAMVTTEATVFIVDDDDAARDGLEDLMKSVGLNVSAFSSAEDFLDSYDEEWRGCVLLDVRMPGMSGLKVQEELKARSSHLPIIFITGHGDVPMAVKAVKNGAMDFLEKPVGDQHLLEKVHEALAKNREVRHREVKRQAIEARVRLLTPREREILDLLKIGGHSKAIALELGLSRKTVDAYRRRILDKLGAESSAELTFLLHESGYL
jgi:FixJ family two-component response regulator